ncbi:hypothetical protein [Bradyrhizobium diversitatis]|uniref:Uncharacterized protein n=1 Tax=Bradyrhizobium diversitatis TaxID=2755406 RepID=A0ABS0P7G1_9BRAD|nr:hypothetical protein [Bradyrhizobium diversitatis]MBH5388997.1 hypothetical protein [Bradyrhizobium diversitatis]
MIRFVLFACMAFTTAFVGVFWAMRGFPAYTVSPISALQPTLTTTFGGESAKAYDRKMWEAAHTSQSDKDPKRDALRLDALQAGTAYAMSPCDDTMKANLVAATTAYARAYMKIFDCPNPMMAMFCSEKKRDEANAAFSTPLDIRVRAALAEAFEQKGVVETDFPEELRLTVKQFAGPGLWSEPSPVCLPRMRAAASGK